VFIATNTPFARDFSASQAWQEGANLAPKGTGGVLPDRFLNSPSAFMATLRRLRGLRLRLTLCRIDLPLGGGAALKVMSALEDRALILGAAPNGAFVALLIRSPGLTDEEACQAIVRRLDSALAQVSEAPAAAAIKIAFAHRWADAMSDGVSLLSEVSGAMGKPLACLRRLHEPSPLIA